MNKIVHKDNIQNNVSQKQLVDMFDRSISYLRVSLTDQCNLRCLYCSPKAIKDKLSCGELLSYEELLRVIGLAAELGIRKVRLTGGEPLVRKYIDNFIVGLGKIEGLEDIRLTTNGVFLGKYAEKLYQAGVRKLNISLDTLKPERFKEITGADLFDKVWASIEKVVSMGFHPVKLNMVALKGINDDELVDFARLSLTHNVQVRYIEFMPIGKASLWSRERYLSTEEIQEKISVLGELHPVQSAHMDGPARIFDLIPHSVRTNEKKTGRVGFISPISHQFCERCNRLRLTSEGKLRSCLLSDNETDLKAVLRAGGSDDDIRQVLIQTILDKPKGHTLQEKDKVNCHGEMSRIGG
ncbi:MAG: GTP 3',8-cyclase MoaA [Desulfobulbaceae bacterium]|uniref:GTP 3',8-cyclase n=1 Tax=Candidatus Desulfobia pelagia TaxID=2841692 RepID=A0A8J6TBM3_9BACT|nr:GTP 3',8-cyclase MoaA [Candidatus Desulfobia pelagia]